MAEVSSAGDRKLRVFISYSRKDENLAQDLFAKTRLAIALASFRMVQPMTSIFGEQSPPGSISSTSILSFESHGDVAWRRVWPDSRKRLFHTRSCRSQWNP